MFVILFLLFNLSYQINNYYFLIGNEININVINNIYNYSVISPSLPSGLYFNSTNGYIYGIPNELKSLSDYTIQSYIEDMEYINIIGIEVGMNITYFEYPISVIYVNAFDLLYLNPKINTDVDYYNMNLNYTTNCIKLYNNGTIKIAKCDFNYIILYL